MQALVFLPTGKTESYEKGTDGVTKLFTDEAGNLVIVTDDSVTKLGNIPFQLNYERKE